MQLITPVNIPISTRTIGYKDKILLLGSCFADNVGKKFQEYYFQTTVNPLGTLYNPASIAQAIQLANSELLVETLPLVEWGGVWHSMLHHGCFSDVDKSKLIDNCLTSFGELQHQLKEASLVIITFGTSWVYEYSDNFPNKELLSQNGLGCVIANCHKMPKENFIRRRLSVKEIVSIWQPLIDSMPNKHWIFTVSPIRHIKDGLHENQVSKAILLQSIDALTNVSYFPAYEIMLDELRDYRFYAEDMVHPSSVAIEYIWQRWVDTFITATTKSEMQSLHQLWLDKHHSILHPNSEEAIRFLERVEKQTQELKKKYPWVV